MGMGAHTKKRMENRFVHQNDGIILCILSQAHTESLPAGCAAWCAQ